MAAPLLIGAGMIGSQLLGELLASHSKAQSREEAERIRQQISAELANIGDPALEAQVRQQLTTSMDGVQTDPALRSAQMAALARLQGITDAGGMDPGFRADLENAAMDTAQRDRSNRLAILSDAQQRRTLNSGMALASQLMSASGAADRNRAAGVNAAAAARQRALQAIQATGQLGGSIRGQDFNENAAKAQARDAMAQFNSGAALKLLQHKTGTQLQGMGLKYGGVNGPAGALAQGAEDADDWRRRGQAGSQVIYSLGTQK